mmetsp:Transcript_35566/g.70547  ORF Transcript_35566/g.70547 Transcript_35566/m.70547 type:complete len:200 (+) Transcript_35566:24-623(+)
MMTTTSVEISPVAYAKMMLHLVKHPHAAVCGYLLGSVRDGINMVEDVVPLFHSHPLAPMLEIATQLIDQHENIVGFYFVNAHVEDTRIPVFAEKVAMALSSKCPGSSLLQILNEKLRDPDDHALQAWGRKENGAWNIALKISTTEGPKGSEVPFRACLSLATSGVANELHETYFDFDDHFEDVSKNPFNPDVDAQLRNL